MGNHIGLNCAQKQEKFSDWGVKMAEKCIARCKKMSLGKVIALGLFFGPIQVFAQYGFQQIDFPGYADSNIGGINDNGDAVGNSGAIQGIGMGPNTAPFIYNVVDGTITGVVPADGYLSTSLVGINDAGAMVGSVLEFDGYTRNGVIRSKDGEYTVIQHPNAVGDTVARAINNNGLVTGIYQRANETFGGFLYDTGTEIFTDLVPSFFTIPHGINSKGIVVGDARFEIDPCGGQSAPLSRYGWVYKKDGSVVLFQVNGQNTRARGISDAGYIAGVVRDPLSGEFRGFVIRAPKVSCALIDIDSADLLQFPGAFAIYPEGISNSGDVVGIFFDTFGSHGFVATEQ